MKALVVKKNMKWPVYEEIQRPLNASVKLLFSALNRRDYWISKGLYPNLKYNVVLGSDGMGYNDRGEKVLIYPALNWGESEDVQSSEYEILGMPRNGTFAEYISMPQKYLYTIPGHLEDEEAAALPLAGLTAYRALLTKAKCTAKHKVLISGVGGGVASLVLLFAVALGAEVYVTSSCNEKIQSAINLGAVEGLNYNEVNFDDKLKALSGDGFDIIIDSAAGNQLNNLLLNCAPGGTLVIYGATQGSITHLNPHILFYRQIKILGSTMGSPSDFSNMLSFVDKYKIRPQIDSIFPLHQSHLAFEKLQKHDQFGKIVFKNQV